MVQAPRSIRSKKTFSIALLLAGSTLTSAAQAHFPWLIRTPEGKAALFFGEGLADRTYKLPPSIAKAEIKRMQPGGELSVLTVTPFESSDFVGLISKEEIGADDTLVSQVTFGIYNGGKLEYYAMHQGGKFPESFSATAHEKTEGLVAQVVDTSSGVDVYVLWHGAPLVDAEVHLYCAEGHEEGTAKTNSEGKVSFTDGQVEEGLNAIMVGHTVKEAGNLAEKSYESASHYLTLTFVDPEDAEPAPSEPAKTDTSSLPPIPFSITSFGAARCADSIYIYGGHTGTAHSYYDESQSSKLLMLDLNEQQAGWQKVAEGERLQGLGMVAHGDRVILIGGFSAKNKEGEKHDLHSQATVRAFDARTNQWSELPALPAGRSSHDAAVIGDTLYVVGGWNMSGSAETEWHTTALAMDLSAADPQWRPLPEPPFQRRAIATVAHAGKLFVIGGMNQAGGPTRAVEIFDPQSQTWESTGELHGENAMAGFGAAGWSADGQLLVTTYEGDIQLYDDTNKSWKVQGQTAEARFFHRLIPLAATELVQIGGANMESGKFLELEVVTRR